jgi:Tfp pilus assembly protein PilV
MTGKSCRRAERGTTIIEAMIAAVVLLIGMTGFVAQSRYAATATAVAHRRTDITWLRSGLIDRLAVTPRRSLATLSALPANTWVVDGCYDVNSQRIGTNDGYSDAGYQCPGGTVYRSWVSSTANANSTWTVSLYVERTDGGCSPAERTSSMGCSAATLLLSD